MARSKGVPFSGAKGEKDKTAVALSYEPGDSAPKILATGKGHTFEKRVFIVALYQIVDIVGFPAL